MTSKRELDRITSKVPSGKKLPTGFNALLRAQLPIRIAWTSLGSRGFFKSAERDMVPFIHSADGTLVALWFATSPPSVVMIDAHGEPSQVIAIDFPNFLRAISASKTGVADIDDGCSLTTIPRYAAKPVRAGITALQRKLANWVDEHSSIVEPKDNEFAESLRIRIHAAVRKMINSGLSKVYTKQHSYWSMNFRIRHVRNELLIEYLDYGKWNVVPNEYQFSSEVTSLLTMARSQTLHEWKLTVTKDGIVSVNNDTEVVLTPPK